MFASILSAELTLPVFLICTLTSVVLGIGSAFVCAFRNPCSKSFFITLSVLPAAVQVVIMLVNGNLGAGVAVAGAFSLVRFRSAPGSARQICAIFSAMAIGLATGMGYVAFAALLFVILSALILLLTLLPFGKSTEAPRILRITIPENLDYEGLFDDILKTYAASYSLEKVKSVNMGTLFELEYCITLRTKQIPKAFLDEIRCRNGNLAVSCSRAVAQESF